MYAVVSTGGKQYRVAKDDVIVVEKLDGAVGSVVTLDVLLIADGDVVTVGDAAASAKVTGEIVEHYRGDKVVVFKFKKRKGYKKTRGHRQELTKVRVTEVGSGAPAKSKTAAKPRSDSASTDEATPKGAAKTKAPARAKAAASEATPDAASGDITEVKKRAPRTAKTSTEAPEDIAE